MAPSLLVYAPAAEKHICDLPFKDLNLYNEHKKISNKLGIWAASITAYIIYFF